MPYKLGGHPRMESTEGTFLVPSVLTVLVISLATVIAIYISNPQIISASWLGENHTFSSYSKEFVYKNGACFARVATEFARHSARIGSEEETSRVRPCNELKIE